MAEDGWQPAAAAASGRKSSSSDDDYHDASDEFAGAFASLSLAPPPLIDLESFPPVAAPLLSTSGPAALDASLLHAFTDASLQARQPIPLPHRPILAGFPVLARACLRRLGTGRHNAGATSSQCVQCVSGARSIHTA